MRALGYKFRYDTNRISFKSVMNFIKKDYNVKATIGGLTYKILRKMKTLNLLGIKF